MRRSPEYFDDQELELLYIARKLSEAQALERVLTERAVDYLVEADEYTGGVIFRSVRVGAFFYVSPRDLERARAVLAENGYRPYRL
jgi:hypothetical protein